MPDASPLPSACFQLLRQTRRRSPSCAPLRRDRARPTPTKGRRWSRSRGARQQDSDRLVGARPRAARVQFIGQRVFRNYDLAEIARPASTGAVLPDLGPGRALSGDPGGPGRRRLGAARVRRQPAHVETHRRRALADAQRGDQPVSASTVDDDIELYADESRTKVLMHLGAAAHAIRSGRRGRRAPAQPLPRRLRRAARTGLPDHVGLFAVTAGLGCEKKGSAVPRRPRRLRRDHGEALADRLAEALAERVRQRVRPSSGATRPPNPPDNDELIAEKYRGIRPRPATRVRTTASSGRCSICFAPPTSAWRSPRNLAMTPAASVSELLSHAHPGALLQCRQDRRGPAALKMGGARD